MINLELYKIFVLVASIQNLTRASERLNLTQPAVTKHIKNLEDLLQVKLFVRSNHGIRLTEIGQKLYSEIKDSVDILMNAGNSYSKRRDINLGIHSTILNKIFSPCISNYYTLNENVKITTYNLENEEMLLKLNNKELDIIFSKKIETKHRLNNIKFIKLGIWEEVLIANKNSKWIDSKLTIEDLKKEILYMPKRTSETTKNFFKSLNCNYEDFDNIRHITYMSIIDILKNNTGIGLVTKEFVENELEINNIVKLDNIELKIEPVEFGIYLNKTNSYKELNEFSKVVKEYFLNK